MVRDMVKIPPIMKYDQLLCNESNSVRKIMAKRDEALYITQKLYSLDSNTYLCVDRARK